MSPAIKSINVTKNTKRRPINTLASSFLPITLYRSVAQQPETYQSQLAEVEKELRASIEAAKGAEQVTEAKPGDQTSEDDGGGFYPPVFSVHLDYHLPSSNLSLKSDPSSSKNSLSHLWGRFLSYFGIYFLTFYTNLS